MVYFMSLVFLLFIVESKFHNYISHQTSNVEIANKLPKKKNHLNRIFDKKTNSNAEDLESFFDNSDLDEENLDISFTHFAFLSTVFSFTFLLFFFEKNRKKLFDYNLIIPLSVKKFIFIRSIRI